MPFDSYYWNFRIVYKERCLEEIDAYKQVETFKDNPDFKKQKYFRLLLQSDNPIAKGFALDRFHLYESQAKKPEDNPFRKCLPEVLAQARAQLQQPPVFSDASIIGDIVGANHASAFLILSLFGTASDLDLITPILHSSSDLNVIYTGCLAAIHCLETTVNIDPPQVFPEVVSALKKHIFNEPDLTVHLLTDTKSERRAKLALVEEVRKQIKNRFRCYYWNPLDLIDPLLAQAYILLVYSSKRNVLDRCYHLLLTSDEPAAIGIALDRYSYTHKQDTDNPYAVYAQETLVVAREQLKQPTIVCLTAEGKTIVGANIASALSLMQCLGEPGDIALIENALANSSDSAVVIAGCEALRAIFGEQPVAYEEKLFQTFSRILFDKSLPISAKHGVFNAIGRDPEASSSLEEWLFSIVNSSLPIKIRLQAALRLRDSFVQHENVYEELYDRHREEIKAQESLFPPVKQEAEVTPQPTPPPTDIRSNIITKKQAELDEINAQITKLDSQINHLNQRIDNLSGGRYNPATTERSLELKQKIKQLNLQKLELESEKLAFSEAIAFYQQ